MEKNTGASEGPGKVRKLWPIFVLLAAAWVYLLTLIPAHAHDWYSSAKDPIYSSSCCGGHDCAPINAEWVREVPEGYRVTMTTEQAQTINPSAAAPVDAVVPWSRVQSPPKADHLFYACIYDRDRTLPRRGVICFFATPMM